MLRRHLPAVSAIVRVPSLEYRVRRYFGLGQRPLFIELRQSGLHHADIVLCLIRIGTRHARRIAESLIGKKITIGPSCRLVYNFNRSAPLIRSQPTVTAINVATRVRQRTRLALCLPEFRVGRTMDQLLMRGVTRGDIKRAVRRGLVTMTEGR